MAPTSHPGTPESPPVPDPFPYLHLRGNRSFKLAWSGRRAWKSAAPGGCTGVSRRQLPADAGFSPAAPSRSARGSARGEATAPLPPPAVAARTRTLFGLLSDPHPPGRGGSWSSSLRWFCPPTHTHAAYSPPLSSLPWDSEGFQA